MFGRGNKGLVTKTLLWSFSGWNRGRQGFTWTTIWTQGCINCRHRKIRIIAGVVWRTIKMRFSTHVGWCGFTKCRPSRVNYDVGYGAEAKSSPRGNLFFWRWISLLSLAYISHPGKSSSSSSKISSMSDSFHIGAVWGSPAGRSLSRLYGGSFRAGNSWPGWFMDQFSRSRSSA